MAAPISTLTPEMSELLVKIVSRQIISTLRTGRGWLPPGAVTFDVYPGPGHEDTYVHGSYTDLPLGALSGYNISEGVTPNAEDFGSDVNEFPTTEKGRVVTVTDAQIRKNPHNFWGVVADKVSSAAQDIIDGVAGSVWGGYAAAGVPVFSPGATPAAANALDTPAVVKAVVSLETRGVEPLDGTNYGCLATPANIATLMLEAGPNGWQDAAKYLDSATRLATGEVGKYRGVTFFSLPRIPAKTGSVYPSYFFGREALAFADIGSLRVTSVPPTPSISDPLAQRGAAGFRVRTGGMLLWDIIPGGSTKRFRTVVVESTPTVVPA